MRTARKSKSISRCSLASIHRLRSAASPSPSAQSSLRCATAGSTARHTRSNPSSMSAIFTRPRWAGWIALHFCHAFAGRQLAHLSRHHAGRHRRARRVFGRLPIGSATRLSFDEFSLLRAFSLLLVVASSAASVVMKRDLLAILALGASGLAMALAHRPRTLTRCGAGANRRGYFDDYAAAVRVDEAAQRWWLAGWHQGQAFAAAPPVQLTRCVVGISAPASLWRSSASSRSPRARAKASSRRTTSKTANPSPVPPTSSGPSSWIFAASTP